MTAHCPVVAAGEATPPNDRAEPAAAPPAPNPLVPVRARHDGWTPERQSVFLEALADYGSVRDACTAVGMSETAAYALRRRPEAEAFTAAWDAALALTVARLAATAVDRALNGTVKRLYYHGELVAEERVYSDRLLTFMLANAAKLFGASGGERWWRQRLDRVEGGGFRVWRNPLDGMWETDFPPPRNFRGWQDGRPLTSGYRRELSRAEKRAVAMRPGGEDARDGFAAAEAARERFFASGGGERSG